MANVIAKQTYYLDADKTAALPAQKVKNEGDDDTPDGAAFLLVRAGAAIDEAEAEKYGLKVQTTEEAEEERQAEEEAKAAAAQEDAAEGEGAGADRSGSPSARPKAAAAKSKASARKK